MLNIYTVSFFRHRYIDNASEVNQRLDCLLHDLIVQKEYVEFLVERVLKHKTCVQSNKYDII